MPSASNRSWRGSCGDAWRWVGFTFLPVVNTLSCLVSVILPAYNAEGTIRSAVASVQRQDLTDWELVAVDDGSTDATAAVLESLAAADPRIRVCQQANAGVAAARNLAIAASSGRFVAPLDADDEWAPTKLSTQVARMRELGERCGFVYTWWTVINADGVETYTAPQWRAEGSVLRQLIRVNFVGSASNPLIRREALERAGGYDPSLRAAGAQGCEDWDVLLRVAEHRDVGLVPERLLRYRVTSGNMSADTAQMWRSYRLVMKSLRQRQPDLPAWWFRASRSSFRAYLAGVELRRGRLWHCAGSTLRAVGGWPPVLGEGWIYDALAKLGRHRLGHRRPPAGPTETSP